MNTSHVPTQIATQLATPLATRVAAMACSTVFTLVMLVSINQLATVDAPAAQMAHNGSKQQG